MLIQPSMVKTPGIFGSYEDPMYIHRVNGPELIVHALTMFFEEQSITPQSYYSGQTLAAMKASMAHCAATVYWGESSRKTAAAVVSSVE